MELLSAFCICNTASGNMGCGYNPLQKKEKRGICCGRAQHYKSPHSSRGGGIAALRSLDSLETSLNSDLLESAAMLAAMVNKPGEAVQT